MAINEIKAKNVVSFTTGEVKEQVTAVPGAGDADVAEAEAAVKAANTAKKTAAEASEVFEAVPGEVPPERPAPTPEAIETKPLNLRAGKYLDEEPQDPDWADEEGESDFEPADDSGAISTFAEVFIPMHDDSTGAVIRKGMVIVCCIVILCCIVAIFMKTGTIGGTVTPDFSALPEQTSAVVSAVLSNL